MKPQSALLMVLVCLAGMAGAYLWGWQWKGRALDWKAQTEKLNQAALEIGAGDALWPDQAAPPVERGLGAFFEKRLSYLEVENARLVEELKAREGERVDEADREARRALEKETSTLRGLPFIGRLRYRRLNRGEARQAMRAMVEWMHRDEELAGLGHALLALGLVDKPVDFKETYLSLVGNASVAFYNPFEKQIVAIEGTSLEDLGQRTAMVHELTHALQDQHFDLQIMTREVLPDNDAAAALTSLIEGDAMRVTKAWLESHGGGNPAAGLLQSLLAPSLPEDASIPEVFHAGVAFPYRHGHDFCRAVLEARGPGARIDDIFEDPPRTTTEILHPDLYLAEERARPEPVDVSGLDLPAADRVYTNVVGEFMIRFLLGRHLAPREAAAAAAGWGGDGYSVWLGDGVPQLFWRTRWRTPEDAGEFFEALAASLMARHGIEAGPADRRLASDGPRFVRLARRGESEVVLIDASSPRWGQPMEKWLDPDATPPRALPRTRSPDPNGQ